MASSATGIKILDNTYVSAPASSVPTATLPLTYFDIPWIPTAPVRSLFFYEHPYPTSYFMETTLPALKRSLSQALIHFFPFQAKLFCPLPPFKPYMLCTNGDSVPLIIAESNDDMNHLIANYPRDTKLLHPIASELLPAMISADGARILPAMALKFTVFPNVGFSIGCASLHVAADASSFVLFMKCWSFLCKSNGDSTYLEDESRRPFYNRDVIKDPAGCTDEALKGYWHWISSSTDNIDATKESNLVADKVRATFVLTQAKIEKLKQWLMSECKKKEDMEELHISTFVSTCSIMWISKINAEENVTSIDDDDNNKFYYFLFAVDCRNRLEFPLPVTYFGNCLVPGTVRAKKGELMEENGMVTAARAIARKIKEIDRGSAMKEVEKSASNLEEMFRSGHYLGVSGSPKLRIYDVDFGWGRPLKVEFLHIDDQTSFGLTESRDEPGGMEVSFVLSKDIMDAFNKSFEQNMNKVSYS